MSVGFFYFSFVTADKPVWFMMIGMLLVGLGLGQLMQTLTIASQNSVGLRDMGVATSASTFFRQIGGTLGTAVLFSVLFTRVPDTIKAAFSDPTIQASVQKAAADPAVQADPKNTQILDLLQQGQSGNTSSLGDALNGDTSFLNSADHRLAEPFLVGFSNATVTVFLVALAVVVVAFILSWFFKTPPLRAKSALQEAADDQAAKTQADKDAAEVALEGEAVEAANEMGALIEPGVAAPDEKPSPRH
jgi:hypothetical protein